MKIIGHQKNINFLNKSFEKNNPAQAYLFSGPEHVGKFTVAMELARKLTDGKNRKINPDIMVVSPEKDIKIGQIRDLQHWLGLSSYFGKYKVAIIDDAEKLTLSAQNALLKLLEEPREKCVLILVCHDQKKILPTVKSRCAIRPFGLVEKSQISQIVSQEKNKEEIIFWSLGRPGAAVSLKEKEGELASKKEAEKELERMFRSSLNDRFVSAEILSKNSVDLINKLDLWTVILRENVLRRNNFKGVSSEKAMDLIDRIAESLSIVKETNSNARLVLENLFLNFS